MNIRKKLLAGYMIIIILVAIIGGVALVMNSNIAGDVEEIENQYWLGSEAAMDFRANVFAIHGHTFYYIDIEEVNMPMIKMHKMAIMEDMENMNNSGIFSSDALLSNYTQLGVFYGLVDDILVAIENDDEATIDMRSMQLDMMAMTFHSDIKSLVDDSKAEMELKINDLQEDIQMTNTILLATMGAVLLFGLVFTFYFSNNITEPINKMTRAADDISSGKADIDFLDIERDDEIGSLAKSFNRMMNSVKLAMDILEEK